MSNEKEKEVMSYACLECSTTQDIFMIIEHIEPEKLYIYALDGQNCETCGEPIVYNRKG